MSTKYKVFIFILLFNWTPQLLCSQSYRTAFSTEFEEAIKFTNKYNEEIKRCLISLDKEDAFFAMCIVAPEISQYSLYSDVAETAILKTLYVQGRLSNFSIGPFQMKPSFVEDLESIASQDSTMFTCNKIKIISGSEREIRNERVKRMSTLSWQIDYLITFILYVKQRTNQMFFEDPKEKLIYWATLYNSGINLNNVEVSEKRSKKMFPRFINKYNYADICIEFFECSEYCTFLKTCLSTK